MGDLDASCRSRFRDLPCARGARECTPRSRHVRSQKLGELPRRYAHGRGHDQPALLAVFRSDRARREGHQAPVRDAVSAHAAPLGLDARPLPGRRADCDRGVPRSCRSELLLSADHPLRGRQPYGPLRPIREGARWRDPRGARAGRRAEHRAASVPVARVASRTSRATGRPSSA